MNLTYCLLAISIILALFHSNRAMVCAGIALTCWAALSDHVMTLTGATYLAGLALFAIVYFNYLAVNSKFKTISFVLLTLLLAGFVLHKIPGFRNQLVINKYWISAATRPLSMWLSFDQVIAALIIYTFSPLIKLEAKIDLSALRQTILILLATIAAILLPATVSGYVKFDPKIPAILPLWAMNNFLFVSFSEEVIFRGFLQATIKKYLPRNWGYTLLAIIIASIIFGLKHYKSGIIFMGLAAICGIFYGYAYDRTKRIVCAMLVHFLLNLVHFLAFTYPS